MATHSNDSEPYEPGAVRNDEGVRVATEPEDPHATLERAFIDEFLARRGYTLHSVERLPPGDREPLLRAAAGFATLRLAEIEARAHLVNEIE